MRSVDLTPCESTITKDDALAVRHGRGDRLVGQRQVQVHGPNLNPSLHRHESTSTVRGHGWDHSDIT